MAESVDPASSSSGLPTEHVDIAQQVRELSTDHVDIADIARIASGYTLEEVETQSRLQDIKLRKSMAWSLIVSYAVANVATILLFFAKGFGWIDLSDTALISFLGGTLGELAAVVIIVARYLFPKQNASE